MTIPSLEIALQSVFFLYAHVRTALPGEIFEAARVAQLPDDLAAYYRACRDEGLDAYARA